MELEGKKLLDFGNDSDLDLGLFSFFSILKYCKVNYTFVMEIAQVILLPYNLTSILANQCVVDPGILVMRLIAILCCTSF